MTSKAVMNFYIGGMLEPLENGFPLALRKDIISAYELLRGARDSGNIVYLIGNGGSATLASHMATDLQLGGVRAVSLTDVAAVTTYMNDVGAHECFSKQIEVLGRKGDILIAISGSGNSANILNGISQASHMGMNTIGLCGMTGGRMLEYSETLNVLIHTPVPPGPLSMPISQDLQQVVLHILTYALMEDQKGN